MWNENYMHLSNILVSKGNAAQRALFGDINKLKTDPLHKIYIIDLFYYRQKLDSKLKFATWYRKITDEKLAMNEIEEVTEKYKSYGYQIKIFTQIIEMIDTFLAKNLSKHKFKEKKGKTKSKILSKSPTNINPKEKDAS